MDRLYICIYVPTAFYVCVSRFPLSSLPLDFFLFYFSYFSDWKHTHALYIRACEGKFDSNYIFFVILSQRSSINISRSKKKRKHKHNWPQRKLEHFVLLLLLLLLFLPINIYNFMVVVVIVYFLSFFLVCNYKFIRHVNLRRPRRQIYISII